MHPYFIDQSTHRNTLLSIFATSMLFAYFTGLLLKTIPIPDFLWWVEIPSVLGYLGIFNWLFDNYLWNTFPARNIPALRIPNLSGTWKCVILSSYDNFSKDNIGRAVIRQTASKFAINIEFEDSKSESTYAAVIRSDKLSTFELNYQYINRPFPPAVTAMNIHHGTASVLISEDLQTMEGEYYTGRGRVRHGSIKLVRE